MKRYLLPALFLLTFVALPVVALAQGDAAGGTFNNTPGGTGNTPPGGTYNSAPNPAVNSNSQYTVQNPLGASSFCGLVKNLLQAAIAVGIPIAVLFIVYAGFKFVLARGNPEKLAEARQNFLWTLIGIAIFLGAWLLASVVANTVNSLGGSQNIISCQ